MSRGRLKAVGERGSWFATVEGERLPCVHQHWVTKTRHVDPNYDPDDRQFVELVEAIKSSGKVILTRDNPVPNPAKRSGLAFERTGYIAIFEVANVTTSEAGLEFDLVGRLGDLQ